MGLPPAAVAAVRQQPGMRLVASGGGRLRAARHPARSERQPGPWQQAGSPGARVRDRPHRTRPADMGRDRPSARVLNSALHLTQSCDYEPNRRAYRYRPAEARRLLEQAGCRQGADGIFSCSGKRLSLRFVTPAGFSDPSAGALADTGAASRCRGGGHAGVRSPRGILRPDPSAGDVRCRPLLVGQRTGCIVGRYYGCGGLVNYTGYCQRLVTAHLDEADRILDDRRRARVLNRGDRGLAGDVPTIPLFQVVATAAYDASCGASCFSLEPALERGELVARPLAHVQPARLELALLDPQVARELGIVAAEEPDRPRAMRKTGGGICPS